MSCSRVRTAYPRCRVISSHVPPQVAVAVAVAADSISWLTRPCLALGDREPGIVWGAIVLLGNSSQFSGRDCDILGANAMWRWRSTAG